MSDFWGTRAEYDSEKLSQIIEKNWDYIQILVDRVDDQLECLKPPTDSDYNPHIVMAYDSYWDIQYWVGDDEYPSMITASSGSSLFGGLEPDFGEDMLTGNGTSIAHAAKAAASIVHYVSLKKWPGIVISDGTNFLSWAIWATADLYGIPVSGFEPSKSDQDKKDRCSEMLTAFKVEDQIPVYGLIRCLSSSSLSDSESSE